MVARVRGLARQELRHIAQHWLVLQVAARRAALVRRRSPFVCTYPERLQQGISPALMQFLQALSYVLIYQIRPGSAFWFNPDSLHAFRPLPRLLTFEYKDYALSNERAQNDAWKTAREEARQEAAAAIALNRSLEFHQLQKMVKQV